jgi:hypothetical protein
MEKPTVANQNEYTDARSRPGARLDSGTDDRELFITEFGELVLEAWEEANDYGDLTYQRNITRGKSDTFPIIGRKRDAQEHEPGDIILGGTIEHNDVEITVDKIVVDSVFIAEIDQLMNHYDVMRPYATQLGQSLSTVFDRRIAIMHILASRVTTRPYGQSATNFADGGGPLPNGYFHADVLTDPAHMEAAAYEAAKWIRRFDIGGGPLSYRMGWAQYLTLAKYTPLDEKQFTGTSNRANATVGRVGGVIPKASNHVPRTNVTTGLAKYQGDFTDVMGHISNMMAVGTLNLRGLKVTMKDVPERLGTLLIASKVNGHGKLRNECSFEVATADATSLRMTNHPDKDLV